MMIREKTQLRNKMIVPRKLIVVMTLLLVATATQTGTAPPTAAAGEVPWGGAQGAWSAKVDWPNNPIHAAVDRDGKVITYGKQLRDGGGVDLWTPSAGLGPDSHLRLDNSTGSDLFCSITIQDASTGNGSSLLLLGGNKSNGNDNNFALRYSPGGADPVSDTGQDMHLPRWYPMATTLWDGSTLVQGGTTNDGGTAIITPEILRAGGGGWDLLTGATSDYLWGDNDRLGWFYPRTWVTPAGRIFGLAGQQMYYIDPAGTGSVEPIGRLGPDIGAYGFASAAVMFAPGKVLQVGGNGRRDAVVIDLNFDPPVITKTASLFDERWYADATVLPDGRVLVSGGTESDDNGDGAFNTASLRPEIWDPTTGAWTRMLSNPNRTPRLYHSTALLLPDGSVWTGGSGDPGPVIQKNAEIFYPPYLFAGNGRPLRVDERPELANLPAAVSYNQSITVDQERGAITDVVAIRNGASTHSTNSQIRIPLTTSRANGRVTFRMPRDGFVAPPGDYMIFALDAAGTPSEAQIIRLRPAGTRPAGTPAAQPQLARQMPRNLRVTETTPSSISMSWTAPVAGADQYDIWVDGRWVQTHRNSTSFTITRDGGGQTLQPNRTYAVEVTAAIGTERSRGAQQFATTVNGGGDDGDGGDDDPPGDSGLDVDVSGTSATANWTFPNDPNINGTWLTLDGVGNWYAKPITTETFNNLSPGSHTIVAYATRGAGREPIVIGTETFTTPG